MITLGKYFGSAINNVMQRIHTVWTMYGNATADESMPFGLDSCPVQGMDAIYADTANDELPVIIGYINTNQVAAEGETRLFSIKKNMDGSYSLSTYFWLHADGTTEMGGTSDNLTRYAALNTALQAQITKMEGQLTLIAAGIAEAGGSYSPGDISLDISGAKIIQIKCQ